MTGDAITAAVTSVPRALVNAHRRPGAVAVPDAADVLAFHAGLPGYRPTPLHHLAGDGGPTVLLKDESARFDLPAFKILGASWALDRALRADPTTTTVVAASAGNHGRAVAHVAAQRGLDAVIYLPATASADRGSAIAAEGARVVRVDGGYDAAVRAAELAVADADAALITDTGTDPTAAWAIDGYATLFHEVAEQAAGPVDLVVAPVGVGSLAAAAVRFGVAQQPAAAVIGVEPAAAACVTASLAAGRAVVIDTPGTVMSGMDCATPSATAWPILRDGLDGTVTVDDAEVHEAMRDLAAAGLTIGDCGAAPLAAVRALVGDPRCQALRDVVAVRPAARVVCIATEGATDPTAYARVIGRPAR